MLAVWLPWRLTFLQEASTSQRFIDEDADLDLFALRAMANVPMAQLARVSRDPVAAWREGDPDTIRKLASLELERVGLRLPPRDVAAVPASARLAAVAAASGSTPTRVEDDDAIDWDD